MSKKLKKLKIVSTYNEFRPSKRYARKDPSTGRFVNPVTGRTSPGATPVSGGGGGGSGGGQQGRGLPQQPMSGDFFQPGGTVPPTKPIPTDLPKSQPRIRRAGGGGAAQQVAKAQKEILTTSVIPAKTRKELGIEIAPRARQERALVRLGGLFGAPVDVEKRMTPEQKKATGAIVTGATLFIPAGRAAKAGFTATKAGLNVFRQGGLRGLVTGGRGLFTGRNIITFGKGAAATEGIVLGTKVAAEPITKFVSPKEERQIRRQFDIGSAVRAGQRAQEAAVAQEQSRLKRLQAELPGVGVSVGEEDFMVGVRRAARQQGATPQQEELILSAALRERTVRESLAIGGSVGVGAVSERAGRELLGRAFKAGTRIPKRRVTSELFGKAAARIAPLGAVEGIQTERILSQARGRETTKGRLVTAGAFGFGSAGLLGGFIAGTVVTRPTVSRVTNIFANIADPFELPGDVTASIAQRVRRPRIPTLAVTLPKEEGVKIQPILTGRPKAKTMVKQVRPKVPTTITFEDIIGVKPKAPTTVKAQMPIPIKPTPTVPTSPTTLVPDISINIPEITPTEVPVSIPTPSPVPTTVPVSIPTTIPAGIIPPPLPLTFPAGRGGGGISGRRRKVFINELMAGRAALVNLLGGRRRRR